jgi:hypothetical protein
MKLPAQNYSVAWFKLTEFVIRGEKERALSLYRLLVHAFEDKALAYQLEADLLLLFGDEAAIDKYLHAAVLFAQNERLIDAITIYEYVLALKPALRSVRMMLIELYMQRDHQESITHHLNYLINQLLEQHDYAMIDQLITRFESCILPEHKTNWATLIASRMANFGQSKQLTPL